MRTSLLAVLFSAVLLAAGCSSDKPSVPEPPPAPVATPLVGETLGRIIPTPASDGRTHLVYELKLTNALSGDVTVNALRAQAGDRQLLELSGNNLKFWMRLLGDSAKATNVIGPAQTATVWLDIVVDSDAIPEGEITHTVDLTVAKPIPGLVDANTSQTVAPATVSDKRARVIAPPLTGDGWANGDGCCGMSAHRTAINPINGQLWAPERFAIDYVRVGPDNKLFVGDKTKVESYRYYGDPVYAVADATVAWTRDDLPNQTPGASPVGLPLDAYGGNLIVLDLGDGDYAFYAHLKPGSVSVRAGDKVTVGQQLAEVGNSGNSDAPHLHFHMMAGPDPLASDGLPFLINSMRLTQRLDGEADLDRLLAGQAVRQQPGFAARDLTEVSPLQYDVMTYTVG